MALNGKAVKNFFYEFLTFGLKQAQACVFAGSFFVLLFLSHHIHIPGLARYDFLFLSALLIQLVLYLTKIETKKEIAVIFLFHIIGLVLEIYKTSPEVGSWSYPEEAFFKLGTVPLYSGFMYASVGSYISQAWKIMKLEITEKPSISWATWAKWHSFLAVILATAIYINFFTNHFWTDIRWVLIPLVFILFWKTWVRFTVSKKLGKIYKMPLNISFILIAFFIWIAENISTFFGAWQYPDQVHVWNVVSTQKITSWFLMVIISFIIVASLKKNKKHDIM